MLSAWGEDYAYPTTVTAIVGERLNDGDGRYTVTPIVSPTTQELPRVLDELMQQTRLAKLRFLTARFFSNSLFDPERPVESCCEEQSTTNLGYY